nr:deoxyribodipyrimidine photo-lyase [Cytophagales bacterium]
MTYITWFRQDLRLSDNPALTHAVEQGDIIPIYILDDESAGDRKIGGASRWWLHHSLTDLNSSLHGHMKFFEGDAHEVLQKIVKHNDIKGVYWNRCYEPWRIKRDKKIKEWLQDSNIDVKSFNGSLLWEPCDKQIYKNDGTPYRVFTPFYRKGCLGADPPRQPLNRPDRIDYADDDLGGLKLDDLNLTPTIPWDTQMKKEWKIGEEAAYARLKEFIKDGLSDYKEGRNFPAKNHVSRLSPHLHWGEISPNQIWYAAQAEGENKNTDHFMSELGWREFSYSLLYHFPNIDKKNLQKKFNDFPWKEDKKKLKAWQKGQTGYPIVDAGMRELWQTGYMHNRVRMIVGSFLVKNLLIHWHQGEQWFWDCLVDADAASNTASWQWVAGTGADAAPYFRIFNPVTQGEKFDGAGEYTRKYVPELKNIPDKYLFKPWEAPRAILQKAGIELDKNYPNPIVDVKQSREQALEAFQALKD